MVTASSAVAIAKTAGTKSAYPVFNAIGMLLAVPPTNMPSNIMMGGIISEMTMQHLTEPGKGFPVNISCD